MNVAWDAFALVADIVQGRTSRISRVEEGQGSLIVLGSGLTLCYLLIFSLFLERHC